MLGQPKYRYGDIVKYTVDDVTYEGKVYIVDAYGTFEQNEEPSYDLFIENYKEYPEVLVKHVRESKLKD